VAFCLQEEYCTCLTCGIWPLNARFLLRPEHCSV